MNAKKAFTRADVLAISERMRKAGDPTKSPLWYGPTSPIAAQVMREIGVSREKMNEAYAIARAAVFDKK